MHTNFIDKKRRNLNLREMQVENVLPEHFAEYYPKFIDLLNRYYEFQNETDSTELINHLFASRDINETDLTLLEYIEDELLLGKAYFKGFGSNETELRAAANFSNTMFRSKGTRFAIEWFFRSFYGEDVEVLYPKENIFLVGDAESRIGADSLRYLTDDKLYQTFAILIRVGISISKWKEVFKLFVHPAGMYLGGEVLLLDDVEAKVVTLNDIIDQYTTPSYVLSASSITPNEGADVVFTATGTNIRNGGTDALYWYGEHITTEDSDFATSLYDSNNKQYLEVNGSIGTFTIKPIIDPETNPLEGNEQFKIYLEDKSGRPLDDITITVQDLIPSWAVSYDPSNIVAEGTTVTITFTGTNVENDGETSLFWYIDEGTSTAIGSELNPVPPTVSSPGEIAIVGSTGSIEITPIIDAISEGSESANFVVTNVNGIVVANVAITITNTVPVLAVSVDNVVEGEDIIAVITADESDIGKTITWTVSGSDARIPVKSGSLEITATTETLLVETTSNPIFQGAQTYTFEISDATIGYTTDDTFDFIDEASVYQLTGDPSIGSEGSAVTYTVSGTNIPDGSVWFYIENASPNPTDNADWTSTPPRDGSRQEIVISSGTGSFSLTYASNGDADTEYYQAYIYDSSTGGTELASASRSILGTSATPTTVVPDKTSVVENGTQAQRTVTFTVTAGSEEADGDYTFTIQGLSGSIDLNDFENSSGGAIVSITNVPFEIASGTASITIIVNDDLDRDGVETFRLDVKNDSGVTVATSSTITIDASSVPEYTFAAYDGLGGSSVVTTTTEEANLYIGADPVHDDQSTETLYIELSGTGASQYSVSQRTITVNPVSGLEIAVFETVGDSGEVEADRTVTATITTGDYASGSPTATLGTVDVTISDAEATSIMSLTANDTTPDENTTVTFTISGSNIPNGTYYYRPLTWPSKIITNTVNAGSTFIPLSNTSSLVVGMSARSSLGVEGTISSVGATGVIMSAPTTSSISASSTIVFAPDADWDWFDSAAEPDGTVSVSSNAGSFAVDLGSQAGNKEFTFAVFAGPTDVSPFTPASTELITIQGAAVAYSLQSYPELSAGGKEAVTPGEEFTVSIDFFRDGRVFGYQGTTLFVNNYVQLGNWITGTFDANNFEIVVSENPDFSPNPVNASSNTGPIDSPIGWTSGGPNTLSWTLTVRAPYNDGVNFSFWYLNITIRDKTNPSNSVTQPMNLVARIRWDDVDGREF